MSPLIQKYLKFAILHEEYTLNGDYKNGNKVHKEIMKTIDKLKFENQKVKKDQSLFRSRSQPIEPIN